MHTLLPFHGSWYQRENTVWHKVAVFSFPLQPLSMLNPNFAWCTLPHPLPICNLPSGNSHCLLQGQHESLLCDVPASAKPVGAPPQDQLHAKLMRLPSFSSISYYVGMCGDGANDCGVRRSSFPILVKFPLFQPKEFCDERLPNTTCHQHFPS